MAKYFIDDLGRRMLRKRKERGMSQGAFAVKSGLNPGAVSMFEHGVRRPNIDNLVRIARALNVSTDWLLGRRG